MIPKENCHDTSEAMRPFIGRGLEPSRLRNAIWTAHRTAAHLPWSSNHWIYSAVTSVSLPARPDHGEDRCSKKLIRTLGWRFSPENEHSAAATKAQILKASLD